MRSIIIDHATKDLSWIHPILDLYDNATVITDEQSTIQYINYAYTKMTGYTRADIIGKSPGVMRSGYHDRNFYLRIWEDIAKNGVWEGEIWNRRKSGLVYPAYLRIIKIQNLLNATISYLGVFSDISTLKIHDAENINQSVYDFLTKLPNALALEDNVQRLMQRYPNRQLGVVYIDINQFQIINDQYGYLAGDLLLGAISCDLNAIVIDPNFLARYGADEFVILIPNIESVDDLKDIKRDVTTVFNKTFDIENVNINTSCKIGVSLVPKDGNFVEALRLAKHDILLQR